VWERKKKLKIKLKFGKKLNRIPHKHGHICVGFFQTPFPTSLRSATVTSTKEWMTILEEVGTSNHPTQTIIYVPLMVNRFQKSILLIVQYNFLKSCSRDFILQNLILRTRKCGTGFITQSSWGFYFHLTIMMVRWKCFVPQLYQFWRGVLGGPALKYILTWFIGTCGVRVFTFGRRVVNKESHFLGNPQRLRISKKSSSCVGVWE